MTSLLSSSLTGRFCLIGRNARNLCWVIAFARNSLSDPISVTLYANITKWGSLFAWSDLIIVCFIIFTITFLWIHVIVGILVMSPGFQIYSSFWPCIIPMTQTTFPGWYLLMLEAHVLRTSSSGYLLHGLLFSLLVIAWEESYWNSLISISNHDFCVGRCQSIPSTHGPLGMSWVMRGSFCLLGFIGWHILHCLMYAITSSMMPGQ